MSHTRADVSNLPACCGHEKDPWNVFAALVPLFWVTPAWPVCLPWQ